MLYTVEFDTSKQPHSFRVVSHCSQAFQRRLRGLSYATPLRGNQAGVAQNPARHYHEKAYELHGASLHDCSTVVLRENITTSPHNCVANLTCKFSHYGVPRVALWRHNYMRSSLTMLTFLQ